MGTFFRFAKSKKKRHFLLVLNPNKRIICPDFRLYLKPEKMDLQH